MIKISHCSGIGTIDNDIDFRDIWFHNCIILFIYEMQEYSLVLLYFLLLISSSVSANDKLSILIENKKYFLLAILLIRDQMKVNL